MGKAVGMITVFVWILLPVMVAGQAQDLIVGEVTFPSLRWGQQEAVFEAENVGSLVKFLVAETEVQFEGGIYLNANRRAQTVFVLPPGESLELRPKVFIPGNFGQAKIHVRLYDVVDTADAILPGQLVFEQPFTITFHIPDELMPYFQERVNLPPRVEEHPHFDFEFARVVLLLLSEGKSPAEMAAMAKCDTTFITQTLESFVAKDYVSRDEEGQYAVAFPVIMVDEAEQAVAIAREVADSLTTILSSRLPAYRNTIDSLVTAGRMTADSNAFYSGGSLLYKPYPVVAALALWWDLGQGFITRSAPLLIYDGTDVCNAHIPQYMYAVQGGPALNGTHFFLMNTTKPGYRITFGDERPELDCGENFILKQQYKLRVTWRPTEDYIPEGFMWDSSIVRPAVDALVREADSLIASTYYRLKELALAHGHPKLSYGYRYWFWNVVATRTLASLREAGVVSRRGNGQYRFDGMKF